MQQLVLASGNRGKLKEFLHLLTPLNFEVVPQAQLGVEEVEETGLSFVENAILKARHAASITGLPALADDSGLTVETLQGEPGVYSARYAQMQAGLEKSDANNIRAVLEKLAESASNNTAAQFHCVLALVRHALDPCPIVCHGIWKGEILRTPQGEKGFGYDPIFFDPVVGLSAGEMSSKQKQDLSHRGQAVKQLVECISAGMLDSKEKAYDS